MTGTEMISNLRANFEAGGTVVDIGCGVGWSRYHSFTVPYHTTTLPTYHSIVETLQQSFFGLGKVSASRVLFSVYVKSPVVDP
jgi:hypothetical protein